MLTAICRVETVKWLAENNRPFQILLDPGLRTLLKTGRPHYYIPHPNTVSRDVRVAFSKTRKRLACMLQVS
jgi:hypothetical protein